MSNKLPQWKIDRIKELVKEGLKQVDIARRLGITQVTVSKYANKRR